jgi:hypothetical protein
MGKDGKYSSVEMPWVSYHIGGIVNMPGHECWQGCLSLGVLGPQDGWVGGLWRVVGVCCVFHYDSVLFS